MPGPTTPVFQTDSAGIPLAQPLPVDVAAIAVGDLDVVNKTSGGTEIFTAADPGEVGLRDSGGTEIGTVAAPLNIAIVEGGAVTSASNPLPSDAYVGGAAVTTSNQLPTTLYNSGGTEIGTAADPVGITPYNAAGTETGTQAQPLSVAVVGFTNALREHVHKFGFVTGVGAAMTSVREGMAAGSLYAYPSGDQTIAVVQTGTQTVAITAEGITAAGAAVTSTKALSGISGTEANFDDQMERVYRAYNSSGTLLTAEARVLTASAGTEHAAISADCQQSNIAAYTVPASKTVLIASADLGFGRNDDAEAYLMVREPGGVMRCKDVVFSGAGNTSRDYTSGGQVDGLGPYAAGTDIEWRCKAASGTISCSVDTVFILDAA